MPSWPEGFQPQQYACPTAVSPHPNMLASTGDSDVSCVEFATSSGNAPTVVSVAPGLVMRAAYSPQQ